jgi:uncharacterized damage-inducible protein DinB
LDLLDRLLGHDEETTALILRRCKMLSDDQLHKQFDVDHGSAGALLRHMSLNVEVWTDLMLGRAEKIRRVPEGIDDLIRHQETVYTEFATMARGVQAKGRLNETYLDVLDSPATAKTYGGTILHVITHNMHHRAHLLMVLRWLGETDLPEGDMLGWELNQLL